MVLAGVSTVLAGCYFFGEGAKVSPDKKKKQKKRKTKKDMSKKEVLAFTNAFGAAIKEIRTKLMMEEQRIMKNAAMQKMPIPPMELYHHLLGEFKKRIALSEKSLYAKHNITEDIAKAAAKKYKEDPEYKVLSEDIQKQYRHITLPPPETPQLMKLEVFTKLCDGLIKKSHRMFDQIEEILHKKRTARVMMPQTYIMNLVQEKTQDVLDDLFDEFNTNKYDFERSMQKHQTQPAVAQTMAKMQQISTSRMRKMGVPAGMPF